ncbi:hypothetical protein ACFFGT_11435 [Mucilaginibacter angelicae]|uniref:Uncharacterized protein n=1 Tax=Mucilaginibacter angelicae TaxID=869718 RepID=A0ABV6L5R2_9SPHI
MANSFYYPCYYTAWDDKYHGTALPSGTCYYLTGLHKGSKHLSGSVVVLIR